MDSSSGVLIAIITLFSGFLALVVAWAKDVMQEMGKRIEKLEKDISDCHSERNNQNLNIGRLEATIEGLKHQIRYSINKRRVPILDQEESTPE